MSNDSAVTTLAAFRETQAKRKADDAKSGASSLVVLYFWAAWHPPCTQMNAVVTEVAKQHGGVQFLRIDVDNSADVAELYDSFVESVPTFLLYKGDKQVAALKGASAPELVALVNAHAKPTAVAHVPPQPAAGAAAAAAGAGAGAGAVALGAAGAAESKGDYEKRVLALAAASPVVAFLNGSPSAPRDDASRELVQILNECRVNFGYFDVGSDAKAADALKALGKHAAWPQLYASGKHVGGLEEVKDLKHGAELLSVFPREALGAGASGAELTKRLLALVSQKRVMLFMKGTPDAPQCGFSRKAVALLQSLGGTTAAQVPSGSFGFGTFDIFTDESVRMGLKEHFNWPTYPQLYVDGKLVGGLDVMNEMNDESELKPLLQGNGAVAPAAAAAAAKK